MTTALAQRRCVIRSLDLRSRSADVRADLTDIAAVDRSVGLGRWTWVLCSHVLEHIPDDCGAMHTLGALLGPRGTLLVQVPHDFKKETYEDWSITTPHGRAQAFGQHDHVRIYGRDLVGRLERNTGLTFSMKWPPAALVPVFELDASDPLFIGSHIA